MAFVTFCPGCQKRIPVETSPAPYVAACPHCSNQFVIPGTAGPDKAPTTPPLPPAPPANPFELPDDSPPGRPRARRRTAREPMSGRTKLFILVGAVAAVVTLFVIYDRVTYRLDRKRFDQLTHEILAAHDELEAREKEIERALKATSPDWSDVDWRYGGGREARERDPEWRRLRDRFEALVEEDYWLLKKHPEWDR